MVSRELGIATSLTATKLYCEADFLFAKVGGEMLDFMLTRLKPHGRVALCGAISDYSKYPKCPLSGLPPC